MIIQTKHAFKVEKKKYKKWLQIVFRVSVLGVEFSPQSSCFYEHNISWAGCLVFCCFGYHSIYVLCDVSKCCTRAKREWKAKCLLLRRHQLAKFKHNQRGVDDEHQNVIQSHFTSRTIHNKIRWYRRCLLGYSLILVESSFVLNAIGTMLRCINGRFAEY